MEMKTKTYENREFLSVDAKSQCRVLRNLTQGLGEHFVRFCVLELNGLDLSVVVKMSNELIVGDFRKGFRLGDQRAGFDVILSFDVLSGKKIQGHCLTELIM